MVALDVTVWHYNVAGCTQVPLKGASQHCIAVIAVCLFGIGFSKSGALDA
jgi:hypothetical protein